jgi:ethanolamine permease
MYVLSMVALFRLRRSEPNMARPFRALGYPWLPAWALLCTCVCMASVVWYNRAVALLFVLLLIAGYGCFRLGSRASTAPAMHESA